MAKKIKQQTTVDDKADDARWGELLKDGGKEVVQQSEKDNAERAKKTGKP